MSLDVNKIYGTPSVQKISQVDNNEQKTAVGEKKSSPAFSAAPIQNVNPDYKIRTQLASKQEYAEFQTIDSLLNKEDKNMLKLLLSSGRLLNNKSNDKTTTLDNLYKIVTSPRAKGLDAQNVLKQIVEALANPFIITQQFGNIPKELTQKVLIEGLKGKAITEHKTLEEVVKEQEKMLQKMQQKQSSSAPSPLSDSHSPDILNPATINVEHSGCCVAASIEFNFAKQYPAEFARFAAGLTSPNVAVVKNIETKNLNDKSLDAVWLLNAFKIPYKMNDFNNATVVLSPDKNAIIRAQIQNSYKDANERSSVDALMQSTFMNVGSQQTYDSLTDVNQSELNQNDRGLGEFEKTFVESVVEDKNTTSVTFQNIDDDGKLTGYAFPQEKMLKYIVDSLSTGNSVIIGYTDFDKDKKLINGHEITIVGFTKDKQGKLCFICNDTDDGVSAPIVYPVAEFLPKIHHAGLPASVLKDEPQEPESWKESLNDFQSELKEERKNNPQQAQNTAVVQPEYSQYYAQAPVMMPQQPQIAPPVVMYNGMPYAAMYQQQPYAGQPVYYNQAPQQTLNPQQIYGKFPTRS